MSTTPRMRTRRPKKTLSLPLTNLVEVDDNFLACIDTATAKFTIGGTSTTLLPVGYFTEHRVGDGTTRSEVDLFESITLQFFDNDASNPIDAGDVGSTCYIKDSSTVSALSTGRSSAGIVFVVDSILGVGVYTGLPNKGATGDQIGVAGSVADTDALSAIASANRSNGALVLRRSDNALFRFDSGSAVTEDEQNQLVVTPDAGSGRWIRADKSFDLKLAFGFGTADAAALCTVPTGYALRLTGLPFYDVTTGFTGGTSSAIGISTDFAGSSTKGDLLGGTAGDVTATLGTTGIKTGTIGAKLDTLAEQQAVVVPAGSKVRFDRIASVYTAGAGFVHVPVVLCAIG